MSEDAKVEVLRAAKAAVSGKRSLYFEIGQGYLSRGGLRDEVERESEKTSAKKSDASCQTDFGKSSISSQVAFIVKIIDILQSGDESMLEGLSLSVETPADDPLMDFEQCYNRLMNCLGQEEVAAEVAFLASHLRRIVVQSIRERIALSQEINQRLFTALSQRFPKAGLLNETAQL